MNIPRLKSRIKAILPAPAVSALKHAGRLTAELRCRSIPVKPYRPGVRPAGVNLTGFIRAEFGLGQSARCLASALEAAGIPFSVIDYQHGASARMSDDSWSSRMVGARYAANLTVINADQLPFAVPRLGRDYWDSRWQIAHYAWELPEYPAEWAEISRRFNEIWTPSRFCTGAVAAAVDRPVYTIPYVIGPKITEPRSRAYFGLPDRDMLFLCMFDVNSVIQRKNPMGAVEAFLRAFPQDAPGVGLVVKVNDAQGTSEARRTLDSLIRDRRNIYLIDTVLTRNDVNALICACDCFVSLHRSEGFGLVMAEAMYFGRPVIATNWSANTDFMTSENSCPVQYTLTTVDRDYAVYKQGQTWAEPDVDDCARHMRRLYEDPALRAALGEAGRQTILTQYSPEAAAAAVRDRLSRIPGFQ